MRCRLHVTIQIHSDFHIGTGSGRGRTIDAHVLTDSGGSPYVLGSSIKGMARAHAEFVLCPVFEKLKDAFELVFGSQGNRRGKFFFLDAHPKSGKSIQPHVVGRNARYRQSGRTRDKSLFFNEIAAGTVFTTTVEADSLPNDPSGIKAIVLLAMSLRRIEALGASRRRGLGQCSVTVEFDASDAPACLAGKSLGGESIENSAPAPPHWLVDLLTSLDSPDANFDFESKASPPAICPTDGRDETWTCLPLIAQGVTPLVLSADRGVENTIESLNFVPGSSIRGAVAGWMLNNGLPADGEDFRNLIVREQMQFGPLYPLESVWNRSQTMPLPLPRSFVECKYEPGERRKEWLSTGHGITDRHFVPAADRCHCHESLTGREGWVSIVRPVENNSDCEFRVWQSQLQTILRTAIDSKTTQRARANNLFATESIPAGTWFAGYVWGPKWAVDLLKARFLTPHATVRIGKSQTRGHGKLNLWPEMPEQAARDDSRNHDPVYPILYGVDSLSLAPPEEGFTLLCYSDLIAIDELLCPVSTLTASMLWHLIGGTGDAPFDRISAFVSTCRIGGFNGIPQLPRTADLAIAAGSTWRFEWRTNDATSKKQAWDKLLAAHRSGIGIRRGEGFGRIMVNPPIHAVQANQNAASGTPEFQSTAHTSMIPSTAASSEFLVSKRLSMRTPAQRLARSLAAKCDLSIRQTAARILWQQSDLPAFLKAETPLPQGGYPIPKSKSNSTRTQLLAFLKDVIDSTPADHPRAFQEQVAELLEQSGARKELSNEH